VGGRTLASKTIEGQFPAFEKVIAVVGDKRAEFTRERLATAIRRVSLLSAERSRGIRLSLAAGRLELTASAPDLGEARETLDTEYSGPSVDCGYNAQYLLDFLGAATSETVAVELKDADSQECCDRWETAKATTATSSCPCGCEREAVRRRMDPETADRA
jgi:DNA polymerase-3 subunit beta